LVDARALVDAHALVELWILDGANALIELGPWSLRALVEL